METFHIITLLVATATLILLLTTAGMLLHNDKRSQKFPPTHNKCPDGWTHNGADGTCYTNEDNLNKGNGDYSYTLQEDPCANKRWADISGVYWDGLTTYNGC